MYGITEETVSKEEFDSYRLTPEEKQEQIDNFLSFEGVKEAYIFNMRHRMEYYLYVDETRFSHGDFLRYLAEYTSKPLDDIILETTSKFNEDVIRHLFELAGGFLEFSEDDYHLRSLLKLLVDEARYFRNSEMLKSLFEQAVDFAVESKKNARLQPLIRDIIPKAIVLLKEYLDSLNGLSVSIVGSNQQLLDAIVLLETPHLKNLTLIPNKDDFDELSQSEDLPHNVEVKKLSESGYRIAEADIIFILNDLDGEAMDEEIVTELLAVRQTPKKQYVIDKKNTTLGDFLQEKNGVHKLSLRTYEDFSFEEKEEAQQYLDEVLDLKFELIMNKYLAE